MGIPLEPGVAVEAAISADRHRLPAAVVEAIGSLWAGGATIAGIAARFWVHAKINAVGSQNLVHGA